MIDLRKKIPILASAAFLLLCLPLAVVAQQSTKPVSEKGLMDALKIGGLQPQELIDIIDKRGVDFTLTPDTEQQLRAGGATSAVIDAVRTHYRSPDAAVSSEVPAAPTPALSSSGRSESQPANPGVFYKNGSSWVQLRPESATWHHEGLMHNLSKDSGGLLHGELTGEVAGTHSPATMHSPASFLIRTTQGAMLQDYLLVHLHEKHDNRNFKVALGGERSADSVDFRAAKIADQVYEIDFTQGAGEYAFFTRSVIPAGKDSSHDGQVLTFRILE
jgi:hypothetical protein